jgi:bifunctional DNase/RNase
MSKPVVEVRVRALVPTGSGCAVFLGNEDKVFVIYVDSSVGSAIGMFINAVEKERPLTHDLMALLLEAVGGRVERVIINDLKTGTYFGRLIITIENELQQRKIIELDARPSDCIALAAQQRAPIYVSEDVWNEVEDMSEVLEKIEESRESESSGSEEETE